jgi:hypothetical protein
MNVTHNLNKTKFPAKTHGNTICSFWDDQIYNKLIKRRRCDPKNELPIKHDKKKIQSVVF